MLTRSDPSPIRSPTSTAIPASQSRSNQSPLLNASPHLRDLSLKPNAIHSAKISIIHPQLRDLILPLERGRVLYPRGKDVEELSWTVENPDGFEHEAEMDDDEGRKGDHEAESKVSLGL